MIQLSKITIFLLFAVFTLSAFGAEPSIDERLKALELNVASLKTSVDGLLKKPKENGCKDFLFEGYVMENTVPLRRELVGGEGFQWVLKNDSAIAYDGVVTYQSLKPFEVQSYWDTEKKDYVKGKTEVVLVQLGDPSCTKVVLLHKDLLKK